MPDGKTIYVMCHYKKDWTPPPDDTHWYGPPGLWPPDNVERVMVSCTFTWDKARAHYLAYEWQDRFPLADVQVGGPAFGDPSADLVLGDPALDFVPGRFLAKGYTITTRGCPGCASPCLVPGREGALRTLIIKSGWNILDNNLLAASVVHIERVLDMLAEQRRAPVFSGGLQAHRFLRMAFFRQRVRDQFPAAQYWFAYDCEQEREPALEAIRLLRASGCGSHHARCYVMVGRGDDTPPAAEERCRAVLDAGGEPFAMLWRDDTTDTGHLPEWKAFTRKWTRPAAYAGERT